jgi:N-succinyl-L-ornithine transcarbamylase
MKQFFDIADAGDVHALAEEALLMKSNPLKDKGIGEGRTLGMVFMNPSLRTRISTEKAARNLGMEVQAINAGSDSWALEFEDGAVMNGSKVEHIRDAAGVMGRYFDIIALRSFPGLISRDEDEKEKIFRSFGKYSGRPLLSLESATLHPLQSLADLMTIKSLNKKKPRVVLSWVPHIRPIPHAVANSFAQWMLAAGMDLTIACPPGMELNPLYTAGARIEHDQEKALQGADFVYAKNWSSWKEYGKVCVEPGWKLDSRKLNGAHVMHCLPARRGVELEGDLMDSPASLLMEQAENRIYAAQVVLKRILSALKEQK